MSHLYIAGDVASVAFSLGERLVDLLKSRLQDFKFTKLVCPSNNWESLSSELQRKHGFKTKDYQCVVWTVSGRLIGNQNDLVKYCKDIYNVECDLDQGTLLDVAEENKSTCDGMFNNDLAVETDEDFAHVIVNSWEKSEY